MTFSNIFNMRGKTLTDIPQPAVTRSKLTIKTLEQGVKYVQTYQ